MRPLVVLLALACALALQADFSDARTQGRRRAHEVSDEDEPSNKLDSEDLRKKAGQSPAEIYRDSGKWPRIPEGFKVLKTKEPRIRPIDGTIRVPEGFEDEWEVYGWGRNMSLAPKGTKELKDAEKAAAQGDKESSEEEMETSAAEEKKEEEKPTTPKSPKSPKSPSRKPSRSPSPARSESPEEWKEKPISTKYEKNKPWWITPKNDFKLDLDLNPAKGSQKNVDLLEGQKVPAIFANRNFKLPQVFEINDKIVKDSFRPDGTGNELPSAKEIEKACRMEVCSYSVQKSGVLLIGDEILQPVPYAGPEKEYAGKQKGTFFVKNGQTLRRYCPADKTQSEYYKCENGKLLNSKNKAVKPEDMVCDTDYLPHIFYHKKQCNSLDKDSVMFYSGYIIPSDKKPETPLYYPLVDICWNVPNAMPYWSRITVHGRNTFAKCAKRSGDFVNPPDGIYSTSPAKLFQPANKYKAYEELLGVSRAFNFLGGVDRGHFTALMDAVYFAWQTLTNEYMNQGPQHGHCNQQNHMLLEKATRGFIARLKEVFHIVTGPIGYIHKEDVSLEKFREKMTKEEEKKWDATKDVDGNKIFWLDPAHQQVPFNMYYAKILYSQSRKSGMAFITSNLPVEHDIDKLCEDVCEEYGWIGNLKRFVFEKGFAYCCKVDDFLNRFPYFGESLDGILPKKLSEISPLAYNVTGQGSSDDYDSDDE